MELVSL